MGPRASARGSLQLSLASPSATILLHPSHVFGGFWLAVRVPAGAFFQPLAGFLLAASGDGEAGGGSSSGCRFRGEVVIERMNILVLEGFLPAQAGQRVEMVRSGGCIGGFEHGTVEVHGQLGRVPAPAVTTLRDSRLHCPISPNASVPNATKWRCQAETSSWAAC